jgi:Xaa-Pro aminopeptidase
MYMTRLERLVELVNDHALDGFLAQTPASLGYLVEFPEDAHERFMVLAVHKSGQHCLICPALSSIQARRAGITNIRDWRDGENPVALFSDLIEEWNGEAGVFLVDDHMPAKMLLEMQQAFIGIRFVSGGSYLGQLTGVKDAEELAKMKAAGELADQVFLKVKSSLSEGMTELDLEKVIRDEFSRLGGNPTFCIVGFGPGAAESHHINSETKLAKDDLVLVDFGCEFQGYNSDITRVLSFGTATAKHKEVYDVVYRAHEAARLAACVGAIPAEVDQAARQVIADAGYGEYFTHRTGHGIGTQVHEHPNISPDNTTPLIEGNCFSIEPGIYLPGEFGVRLENLYSSSSSAVSFNAPISPVLEEV